MDFLSAFQLSQTQITLLFGCVPATTAIVAIIKPFFGQGEAAAQARSKWAPVLSLLCGEILAVVVGLSFPEPPLGAGVLLIGLGIGLAASGLWSQGKALLS